MDEVTLREIANYLNTKLEELGNDPVQNLGFYDYSSNKTLAQEIVTNTAKEISSKRKKTLVAVLKYVKSLEDFIEGD